MSYLLLAISVIPALVVYFLSNKPLLGIAILLVGSFVAFYLGPTGMKRKDTNVMIVGVTANFAPFTYVEKDEVVGFDVDLINEIGKRLNKTVEIQNMPFASLLPALQLGSIQVICSGLTATPERAKHVLFTSPYLEGNSLIIVSRAANPLDTVADLTDKDVIVNQGYTADLYLSTIVGPRISRLKTVTDAFLALSAGRAVAFVTAQNTVQSFFEQHDVGSYHISVIPDTDENASIAVSLKYPELLQEIQAVLDTMKQDGSLEILKKKWKLQ